MQVREFKSRSVLANSRRNPDGSSDILGKTIHKDVQMSVVVVSGTPQPWGTGLLEAVWRIRGCNEIPQWGSKPHQRFRRNVGEGEKLGERKGVKQMHEQRKQAS